MRYSEMKPAPLPLFQRWIAEAGEAEHDDPTAFALATVDAAGQPSVRMLLLKGATEAGFIFYTNMNSRKAEELQGNPRASMCFHWKKLRRQFRVSGSVTLVSDAEADAYFASRDHASKVGAWASLQSSSMSSRGEFEQRVAEYRTKYPEGSVVPRPPHWSGWLLQPAEVEFLVRRRCPAARAIAIHRTPGRFVGAGVAVSLSVRCAWPSAGFSECDTGGEPVDFRHDDAFYFCRDLLGRAWSGAGRLGQATKHPLAVGRGYQSAPGLLRR